MKKGPVQVYQTCQSIRDSIAVARSAGQSIGLVPTMGALHDGHVSLIQESARQCDQTVVSIFVNPTQFGPAEDLDRYPRTLEADLAKIEAAGGTMAFAPGVAEMYPDGCSTTVNPPEVSLPLEGMFRPDHFRGVATVVLKLFNAMPADQAFFGQKDYQQLQVIKSMVRDLNLPIQITGVDTVREPDGLAMSSRNRYLSGEDRQRALALSQALQTARQLAAKENTSVDEIESAMMERLAVVDRVDYACVVDVQTLTPIKQITDQAVALIAAHVSGTRLIDNAVLSVAHLV